MKIQVASCASFFGSDEQNRIVFSDEGHGPRASQHSRALHPGRANHPIASARGDVPLSAYVVNAPTPEHDVETSLRFPRMQCHLAYLDYSFRIIHFCSPN